MPKGSPILCEHGILGKKYCPDCRRITAKEYSRIYRETTGREPDSWSKRPETLLRRSAGWRRHQLKKYSLTIEDEKKMLAEQNGRCAICGSPPKKRMLCVDHCHKTGQVRGMLCGKCNTAIGMFEDCPSKLRMALKYLIKYHKEKAE